MYLQYYTVKTGELHLKPSPQKKEFIVSRFKKQPKSLTKSEERAEQLADRALLLLSFKDTPTQNLRYVMNALGIRTVEEKKRVLQEIYRLIREEILFVPRDLPKLIEEATRYNKDYADEVGNIDLRLLQPYEQIIEDIEKEISDLQKEK
ncbi:MAG: hypothetical protein EAX86_06110 [Candidatus Heimdallarchaeota archaeon]|nr:hypothetical protein [Candidatus Heimdallarchaeota archaeon]